MWGCAVNDDLGRIVEKRLAVASLRPLTTQNHGYLSRARGHQSCCVGFAWSSEWYANFIVMRIE
jgi:hypothetical protein